MSEKTTEKSTETPRSQVGVLGGGQLGRMFIEAANRLNVQVSVLDADNAPAKQISAHNDHVTGSFTDSDAIFKLAELCEVMTVEIEHVNVEALKELKAKRKDVRIEPAPETLRIIQDKFLQKEHLHRAGIPLAEYLELRDNTVDELTEIASKLGYPLMLKAKKQAYDGKGNYRVTDQASIPTALETLSNRELYAEKWASFRMELAVMVVRTKSGVYTYPTVETVHEDSICKLVYAPPRNVSSKICTRAQKLAKKAIEQFSGKGVFGVEMFLLDDKQESLLINEIAPRPHNSGHYTIEACGMSQYEAHLRAILDIPIPEQSLKLKVPAAIMLNILGGKNPGSHLTVRDQAYRVPNASIHLYGKGDGRPGRKMGHVTVTGSSMPDAEKVIGPLIAWVNQIRSGRSDTSSTGKNNDKNSTIYPSSSPSSLGPDVAVTMGSDSDFPVLVPGLNILTELSIPFSVHITSAHRTPKWMAEFAEKSAAKRIKVIIAAAGGAAHLPGMIAAHTTLPVIGVPVKGSSLDGVDSLHSIVQMPRGVPVATGGINNSVNAALLAARIVGVTDEQVRQKVAEYVQKAENEVMAKNSRLESQGFEAYVKWMNAEKARKA